MNRRYWWQGVDYSLSREQELRAVGIAREAARRVDVPFLVVDVAQQLDGTWIIIECNDGQESGYAGVSPFSMWQTLGHLAISARSAESAVPCPTGVRG